MKETERQIGGWIGHPLAWSLFVVTLGACAWIGRESVSGLIVAGLVSLVLFVTVTVLLITRKKLARLIRQERNRRFQAAHTQITLDAAPVIMWKGGPDARRTFLNAAWDRLMGRTSRDPAGANWSDCIHPDDRQACLSAYGAAWIVREPLELEYRVRRADGVDKRLLERAVPWYDDDEEFCGFVGASLDVTELRREDADRRFQVEQLTKINETLGAKAHELVERYEKLDLAKREAARSDRVKTEFLRALAEELPAPIREIHKATTLLSEMELVDRQKEYVKRAKEGSDILDAVLARVYELAPAQKPATPDPEAAPAECELRLLMERISAKLESSPNTKGYEIDCTIDEHVPPMVKAESMTLNRILLDVGRAALRLARKRPVTITVGLSDGDDGGLCIRFIAPDSTDTPETMLGRLLYPIVPVCGGAPGLGLGASARLAEQIGGLIDVSRTAGGDVTFCVRLKSAEPGRESGDRRGPTRFIQENVRSSLGPVIELSMAGMRVQCAKVPQGTLEVEISDDTETIKLKAEVSWSKKTGFRKNDVGMKFIDVSPETATKLGSFATRNRPRRVLDAA